jgi:glycerol-3-phosphate dehydrogenase
VTAAGLATIAAQRQASQEALRRGSFDLLVIGGGILGIGTAWVAARAGLRVALVDKGDFASATSSASTKLVHGGLRYLAMGGLKQIRENHAERRALANQVAPHLVRPLPFLVPLYEGAPHGRAKIGAGVTLYSALSRFADGAGGLVTPQSAERSVPGLRTESLRACGRYFDHQMNDARLAVTVARAAAEAGAVLLNHTEVVALRSAHGALSGADLRDTLDGSEYGVEARVVVNAAGPWVDHVRRLESAAAAPSIRLSKGSHLVMRQGEPWKAALTIPIDEVRVSFAIPWEDHLLLGTTDEAYDGDPADVRCTQDDTDQILAEAAHAVLPEQLDPDGIVYSYAGLRVLPAGPEDTKRSKRETVISVGPQGLITVAGGKWTTFRRIAATVLETVRQALPSAPLAPQGPAPLPGVAQAAPVSRVLQASAAELPANVADHLARHYGTLSHDILALGMLDPALLDPIHPGGPDIWAQVEYAARREWACTVDDVLRRRTTVTVRGLDTPEIRDRVAEMLDAGVAAATRPALPSAPRASSPGSHSR